MADNWSSRWEDREDWRDRDRDRDCDHDHDRGSRHGTKRHDRYLEERRDWDRDRDRDREPRDDYESSRRHSRDDYVRSSKRPRDDSDHSATSKQNSPKRRPTADEFFEQRPPSLKQTIGQVRNLTWKAPKSQVLKRESPSVQSRGINVKTQGNISQLPSTPVPITAGKERYSPRIHPYREKLQSESKTSMDRDHVIADDEPIIGMFIFKRLFMSCIYCRGNLWPNMSAEIWQSLIILGGLSTPWLLSCNSRGLC